MMKNLDKLKPYELSENQKISILKCLRRYFYETRMSLFSTVLSPAIGSSMTTGDKRAYPSPRQRLRHRPYVSMIMRQKLNEMGYEAIDLPPYSPDLLHTDYPFSRHLTDFLVVKSFRIQGDAETIFNDSIASRTPDFYQNGIHIHIYNHTLSKMPWTGITLRIEISSFN
ncbi:hypothetical protein LAZ67_4003098 [Cordylochernes scorpioides]|uniref:Uncharacterized protein n=1 Tax=Cordylochernes scorpioides TaxID=51811 RepID=A0ABY6KDC2_9ARAC|nr:hypothetical protein LAZ67_4003098 [Cordylochernes scorpioides]